MGESTTDGEPRLDDSTPFEDEVREDEVREHRGSGEPRGEQGTPHTKVGRFMRTMGHLRSVYGPADHRDLRESQPDTHNPEDVKESHELDGIDVQTDSQGHHYGVRREPGESQGSEEPNE
ncbi:hypothetical protein SPF06_05375 [Sinomonas sp. JGH33]|uniref:Uncharacterized protein n=1 Tax=Sinomonas terricola TaxID=3110330 RepID=A0ABU5T3U6_9MICC|nr:hypothetical protein [Sinomonas sp. JGH33]MEA5454151.1 hypothetical protein [Sinomonas sp. JGH33]